MSGKKKRLHITLVNPPYPDGSFLHPTFPSLGLAYLAAVLEKNQFQVDLIDCQTSRFAREEFRKEIRKRQPDVVGITSTILTYKSALQIAKIAKDACPKCLTVLGGPFVSFWDEKALQESASVDIIVRKEGENTMLELAERVEAGKEYYDVLGTTCRKKGKIVRNPDRAFIENLDDIPFPARNLWPIECLEKYGTARFQVMTSRGCVNWCNFCTEVRMDGRKYRMRSPKNVVDELEFLHNTYGAKYFAFLDDAFTVDKERAVKICEEIKNRKLNIDWTCETRVDLITKDLLLKMKEAGCVAIWYGIESGSQLVLNAMGKGISLKQIVKAFKMTKDAGMKPNPNVILGFPGETKETAWKTIRFIRRLAPEYMGCYTVATPYPGTPMYNLIKEKGWLKITDFEKYDTGTPTFETPTLCMKELKEIYDQVFKEFYLHPTYVLRTFAKGGTYSFSAARRAIADLLIAIRFKLSRNLKQLSYSHERAYKATD
jgi:anaerobic magnesium-protoporphyrin IX monomethyl ester cyclase